MGNGSSQSVISLVDQNEMLLELLFATYTETNENTATGGAASIDNSHSETTINGNNYEGTVHISYGGATPADQLSQNHSTRPLQMEGPNVVPFRVEGSGSSSTQTPFAEARTMSPREFMNNIDRSAWHHLRVEYEGALITPTAQTMNILLCVTAGLALTIIVVLTGWYQQTRRYRSLRAQ
jgi:hypothetical protein